MKIIVRFLAVISMTVISITATASDFDKELADKLGADDYGMSQYVLVLLKTGAATDIEGEALARLQRGHMDTINRLANEGHLLLAGPFIQEGDMRGVFVFDSADKELVKQWVESDPAVSAGFFQAEYYSWYGAAGLRKLTSIQERITKQQP